MATLTSQTTFSVANGATTVESVPVVVLPVAGPGEGRGRLTHPTLGTYDYPHAPDEWTNLDTDIIAPPVWATQTTLTGAANTLWDGSIADVVCEERWTGGAALTIEHLRMLLSFWCAPPDPASGYIVWSPSYATALSYNVIILSVSAAGEAVTLDALLKRGWVAGPVVLRMRVVSRA